MEYKVDINSIITILVSLCNLGIIHEQFDFMLRNARTLANET